MSDTVKLVTDLKTYTGTLSGNADQVLVVHNNNETVRVPFDQFKNSQSTPSVPTSPTSDGTEGDISVTEDAVYTYTNGEWGKSPRELDWGAEYLRIDQGAAPLTSDQLVVLQSALPKATEEGPGIVALANDVAEKYPEGYAATPDYVNTRVKELEDLKRGPAGPPGPKGDVGIFLEEFTYYTTSEGNSDINFRWAQLGATHAPEAGTIVEVRIPFRSTASDAVTSAPVYLSLFEETATDGVFAYRGTSTNAVVQRVGGIGTWKFDHIVLGGGKLRVSPSLTADSITLADNLVLSGRGVFNDSDSCYVRNTEGQNNNYALQAVFKYVTVKVVQGEQGSGGAATSTTAGLVKLGTDNSISTNIVPVGVNVEGQLFADVSEAVTASASAAEKSDYNAYGFGIIVKGTGNLKRLTTICRSAGSSGSHAPVWCKVWKVDSAGTTFVALSSNSQVHNTGETLVWEFDNCLVEALKEYKFTFHLEEGKNTTNFATGVEVCFRVVKKSTYDGVGMCGQAGGYATAGATGWQPMYSMSIEGTVYSSSEHSRDFTLHLTASEHAALSQLLERKDDLLALLA